VSKHRAGAAPKHRPRDGSHRAEVRPRYGRIVTLVASLAVTVVAAVGGAGLLPSSAGDADPASAIERASDAQDDQGAAANQGRLTATPGADTDSGAGDKGDEGDKDDKTDQPNAAADPSDRSLPAASGEGRRIVFSQSRQRVWLVDGEVERTYLVSGSVYDNLDPGTFEVYSRSEDAVGIDDSGTMQYFVRFTTGDEGAAIGFHDIPIDEGEPVQTLAELGTPLSHGCIRQKTEDAIALWDFAPVGTTVVVTA